MASPPHLAGQETHNFIAVAEAAIETILSHDPEQATDLGDHRFDDRISDRSVAGEKALRSKLLDHKAQLAGCDQTKLGIDDQVDAAILATAIDSYLFTIDKERPLDWHPAAYNAGNALWPLISRETQPLDVRLRSLASRMRQFPELVQAETDRLHEVPEIALQVAKIQNAGAISLVQDDVSQLLAPHPKLRSLVAPAQQIALRALAQQGKHLEALAKKTALSPRLGDALFTEKLALSLDSPTPPQELLKAAHANLDAVTQQLYEVAIDYLGGPSGDRTATIKAALDRVAERRPTNDTVLTEAQKTLNEATEVVRNHRIITLPDDPIEIQVMPEFRRGVAVAYCEQPGPFEKGGKTLYAVSPCPSTWSQHQVESFYREYNLAMLKDLTVHEARPGHADQLAFARRYQGNTRVRPLLMSGTFVEGWAVQMEKVMAKVGFGGPAVRLQQLKMQLRMSINTIIDISVHCEDMSQDEAVKLMIEKGFQERSEAEGKWRRVCQTSTQLCTYFVGYKELDPFIEQRGTGPFDDIIAHGSISPRHLAKVLSPTSPPQLDFP